MGILSQRCADRVLRHSSALQKLQQDRHQALQKYTLTESRTGWWRSRDTGLREREKERKIKILTA